MIAQISSPIRALVILFALIGSLYVFRPYVPLSSLSSGRRPPTNPPAQEEPQSSVTAKAPHSAASSTATSPAEMASEPTDKPFPAATVNEGAPRIRQATMTYEAQKINHYERSIDTHIKHGERWGWPTHILRQDIVGTGDYGTGFYNKPAYLLGLMIEEMTKPKQKRAEWIVWFDADTIILNPAVPWTLFLPPPDFDEVYLLATQDFNGFNAGMAILRVNEWSVHVLSETVALGKLRPEVHVEHFDQGAFRAVFEQEGYAEHVLYQPHNWWNSFGLAREPYDTDAFTLHFAGVDCCGQPESKGTVMTRWLDIVENKPQEYAVELEKTKYPKQVEDYWAMLKKVKEMMEIDPEEDSSRELQTAKTQLWNSYLRHADNATEVLMSMKKVEGVMARLGIEPGKHSEPNLNPTEEALKEAELKENTPEKAKEKAKEKAQVEAQRAANSAKKEGDSSKNEEKPAKTEEASVKSEAVDADKKEAQAKKKQRKRRKTRSLPRPRVAGT